jgi:hypothetical protein
MGKNSSEKKGMLNNASTTNKPHFNFGFGKALESIMDALYVTCVKKAPDSLGNSYLINFGKSVYV